MADLPTTTSPDSADRDDVQPRPVVWPECPTCEVAYVLRRALTLNHGWVWIWQRDCKHKSEAQVHDERERDDA